MHRSTVSLVAPALLAMLLVAGACGSPGPARGPSQPGRGGGAAPAPTLEAQNIDRAGATTGAGRPSQAGDASASQAAPTACPIARNACDFAGQVNDWMLAGDIDAILAQLQPNELTCDGPVAVRLGGPHPLCDGASAGEQRVGYPWGHMGSEGTVVSEELTGTNCSAGLRPPSPLISMVWPATTSRHRTSATAGTGSA